MKRFEVCYASYLESALFAGGQTDMGHSGFVVYLATACFLAYFFSGHTGVYLSQRVAVPKLAHRKVPANVSLREARGAEWMAEKM